MLPELELCESCGTNFASETNKVGRNLCLQCIQSRPIMGVLKIGRNEQCPCGSKRKFKKCHGKLNE